MENYTMRKVSVDSREDWKREDKLNMIAEKQESRIEERESEYNLSTIETRK